MKQKARSYFFPSSTYFSIRHPFVPLKSKNKWHNITLKKHDRPLTNSPSNCAINSNSCTQVLVIWIIFNSISALRENLISNHILTIELKTNIECTRPDPIRRDIKYSTDSHIKFSCNVPISGWSGNLSTSFKGERADLQFFNLKK